MFRSEQHRGSGEAKAFGPKWPKSARCLGQYAQDVSTNLQQIDEQKFVFQLEDAATINHIVVFLLPTSPFPDGLGASVHFQWPGKEFQLLGGLSNTKPSAIFRLKNSQIQPAPSAGANPQIVATLGISVEPLQAIQEQLQTSTTAQGALNSDNSASAITAVAKPAPSIAVVAEKILRNLYNYLAGFATNHLPPGAQSLGDIRPGDSYVPLQAFQEWHNKFGSKMNNDPTFLERDDGN